MKALKALVIGMAILIVVGVAVVGVTIMRRAGDLASDSKKGVVALSPAAAPGGAPPPAPGTAFNFGVRTLDLPPGSLIVSVQAFESRVLAHVRLADGGTRILLLDPLSGDIAGEWRSAGGGIEAQQVPTRPQPGGPITGPTGGRAGRP